MSSMTINGRLAPLPDDPDALLVEVIRDDLDLTGTKLVCGAGVCGACTVLLDGAPVVSCLMPARAAAGKSVTTVEGIGAGQLHPVQKAFMAHDALQCGFCTPGFVVEAAAFCDSWRKDKGTATPSREEIGAALSGHLCRCGAYDGIFNAVAAACAGQFDGAEFAPPRVEARAKVTGAARYTVDIRHDGQQEGVILRSQWAHARITELDLAPARAIAGVQRGDLAARRRPHGALCRRSHRRRRGNRPQDRAGRHRGDPDHQRTAALGDRAGRRAPTRFARGVREGQPQARRQRFGRHARAGRLERQRPRTVRGVFAKGQKGEELGRGSARAAKSAGWSKATFRTGTQSHTCLEPHATVARFDGDRLTVHASTQSVFHVMELIAKRYKLAHDKVRVIADHVGGGFGSKGTLGMETIAAIELAREAKAPVRIAYDRHEELSVTGYRPAAEIEDRAAAVRAGRPQGAVADRLCRHRVRRPIRRSPHSLA